MAGVGKGTIYLHWKTREALFSAVLLSDAEILGGLAKDTAVAAAQQELAGNENYLELLQEQGLLRPGLTVASAGHILGSVMRGFFAGETGEGAEGTGLPPGEQADLLAEVLRRSLEREEEPPPEVVAALAARVSGLLAAIVTGLRDQLERAYG